jgi:hypothetical protein
LRERVHPLVSFSSPSECWPPRPRPTSEESPGACRRVAPPSRHQLAEFTDGPGSHARPSRSALGVSHALDGLLLRVPCRLVSSRSHVQGSHSRGLLPLPSSATSSMTPALMSLAPGHLPRPKPRHRPPGARLQGFTPDSDSKPLGKRFRSAELRSPPVFSLPRALLRAPWNRLHGPSAHDLGGECSLFTRPLAPSVSIGARPGDPSLDHPPVRDFQPAFQPDRSRTFQRGPTYQAARCDRRTVAGKCRRRATTSPSTTCGSATRRIATRCRRSRSPL